MFRQPFADRVTLFSLVREEPESGGQRLCSVGRDLSDEDRHSLGFPIRFSILESSSFVLIGLET
jgi:hypothetical protein